jgi:hypothetical protein
VIIVESLIPKKPVSTKLFVTFCILHVFCIFSTVCPIDFLVHTNNKDIAINNLKFINQMYIYFHKTQIELS